MISKTIEKFCREYWNIENYKKAVASKEKWECHHRLEIDGDIRRSRKELINLGLYWNRPAEELIFLTKKDHVNLHQPYKDNTFSEETRKKISEAKKGSKNPRWKGKVLCIETGEVYESAKYAEKELGIRIGGVLRGIYKTAGGFHWKYID